MINEIQHGNITTTASRGQGGSRFEPQPKGYGMSQNHHFECPQATFDSGLQYEILSQPVSMADYYIPVPHSMVT